MRKRLLIFFNCCVNTVRTACREQGVSTSLGTETFLSSIEKSVRCVNINNQNDIKEFSSITQGARWILSKGLAVSENSAITCIGRVANGKAGYHATAYGFYWYFI